MTSYQFMGIEDIREKVDNFIIGDTNENVDLSEQK